MTGAAPLCSCQQQSTCDQYNAQCQSLTSGGSGCCPQVAPQPEPQQQVITVQVQQRQFEMLIQSTSHSVNALRSRNFRSLNAKFTECTFTECNVDCMRNKVDSFAALCQSGVAPVSTCSQTQPTCQQSNCACQPLNTGSMGCCPQAQPAPMPRPQPVQVSGKLSVISHAYISARCMLCLPLVFQSPSAHKRSKRQCRRVNKATLVHSRTAPVSNFRNRTRTVAASSRCRCPNRRQLASLSVRLGKVLLRMNPVVYELYRDRAACLLSFHTAYHCHADHHLHCSRLSANTTGAGVAVSTGQHLSSVKLRLPTAFAAEHVRLLPATRARTTAHHRHCVVLCVGSAASQLM